MSEKAVKKLLEVDQSYARGERQLVIEGNEPSATALVTLILRQYRGRNDLTHAVQDSRIQNDDRIALLLEQVRTSLYAGDSARTEELLSSVKIDQIGNSSALEVAELLIEKLKLEAMQGKLDEAWDTSEKALSNPALIEISRMTCYQMRGSIRIRQKRFAEALIELQKAASLAELFPHAASAFNGLALLAQAYAETGRQDEAERTLHSLQGYLSTLEDSEVWLDRLHSLLRAQAHCYRASGQFEKSYRSLLEAKEVSLWLGDQFTLQRCMTELSALSDAVKASSVQEVVYRYSGWSFLPAQNLILTELPKSIIRLDSHPLIKKILMILAREKKTSAELFELVWNQSYHSERHGAFLRANLSKVRKLLPKGALRVSDGDIFLV